MPRLSCSTALPRDFSILNKKIFIHPPLFFARFKGQKIGVSIQCKFGLIRGAFFEVSISDSCMDMCGSRKPPHFSQKVNLQIIQPILRNSTRTSLA